MGWGEFILAFASFFFTHIALIRPAVKNRITAKFGARNFTIFYSVVSLIMLGWIIKATNEAPYIAIWSLAPWQYYFPQIGMMVATLFVAATLAKPNPFSFGGSNNHKFDPTNPGIIRYIRHPILAALFIWSLSHLFPNGDLAHIILFGAFACFSILGMKIIDRRNQRLLGVEEWKRLTAKPGEQRIQLPSSNSILRLLIAVLIYVLLFYFHENYIGVSPII